MPARVRALILLASAVVVAEALVVLALAVADLANISGERLGLGIGVAIFFGSYGVGQLVAVVLLNRGVAGARGPLVLTQLIQLGLAWNLRDVDFGDVGIPGISAALVVSAAVVLICLLAPSVGRALEPPLPDEVD